MLLGGGRIDGAQLLRPETVAEMGRNQVGDLAAGVMRTVMPERTNDFALFPDGSCRWGLAYMINTLPGPERPQRRQPELGRHLQQLLLDRPGKARRRRDPDPDPALCRSRSPRPLRRLRARGIRDAGVEMRFRDDTGKSVTRSVRLTLAARNQMGDRRRHHHDAGNGRHDLDRNANFVAVGSPFSRVVAPATALLY